MRPLDNADLPRGWAKPPLEAVVLPVEKVKPDQIFEDSFLYVDISYEYLYENQDLL
jgi:hypothetical protein